MRALRCRSLAGAGFVGHAHPLDAADEVRTQQLGLRRELDRRQTSHQLLEEHAQLEPREVRTETEVLAFAERDVLVRLAVDDELMGSVAEKVMREATGGLPKVVEPGDLAATAEQSEVSVQPGKEVRLTVKIDRRNGFKGRVPLDVRGLPHGVRVLDIGLNGILITEQESSRTFAIYAEPWVQPTTHPFVVLAKSEKKNTEHAAKSVLLKVVK